MSSSSKSSLWATALASTMHAAEIRVVRPGELTK